MRGELDRDAYDAEVALVRSTLEASGAQHWKEYLAAWDES
jgi:hypothetical protein